MPELDLNPESEGHNHQEDDMIVNPSAIPEGRLAQIRMEVAREYGISPHRQYTEREAARLLIPPDERPDGSADVSTLKRKRRTGKIPFVDCGDGSVAYLGLMLCDFIVFGRGSPALWGNSTAQQAPEGPSGSAAPTP